MNLSDLCRSIAPQLQAANSRLRQYSNPSNDNSGRVSASHVTTAIPPTGQPARELSLALQNHAVVNLEQVQSYLARGAELSAGVTLGDLRESSPLHAAAQSGNGSAVVAMIATGQLADINGVDGNGFTPLALLCGAQVKTRFGGARETEPLIEAGRVEALEALLGAGADQRMAIRGFWPIHYAARHNFPELITRLVERDRPAGIDSAARSINMVDCRDRHGNTPLHIAARNNQREVVIALLQMGANVNILNKAGQTPLHQLCMNRGNNNVDGGRIAVLLLQSGVNIEQIDNMKGFTWSQHAGQNGMDQLLRDMTDYDRSVLSDLKDRRAVALAARDNVSTGFKHNITPKKCQQIVSFLDSLPYNSEKLPTLKQCCHVVILDTLKKQIQKTDRSDIPSSMNDAIAQLPLPTRVRSDLTDVVY
ncbi:ankyrin repeat domain-containing protein [Endozoicomonas sp. SCSIO W0465]|uniref:ankyrin repeat domain-containing protein n=1 Tax=Endozoicomonas sp. SCSIO W0465 TaxID=2918516 RepID=UPI002075B374|nr:ankyrin repeat domain-containing protein [Endozoicomonas sp. SCSIO W0465]USE35337.1 ankyrin repeat domain-containing protein [Endozoicomonas sp. SCSIO W0465]